MALLAVADDGAVLHGPAFGIVVGFPAVQRLAVEHADPAGIRGQAPIAVPGEARIPGPERQALDGAVVEAEIEHGVHHAGHGEHRAGAHRYQQRILRVAEATAHDALEARERLALLRLEAGWQRALVRVVPAAHLGRDGEAGRHGHAGVRHLGEPGALAAEQRLHARVSFRSVVLAEEVDVLRGVRWLRAGCQRPGRCRHASFLLSRRRRPIRDGTSRPPQRQGISVAGGWKLPSLSSRSIWTSVISSFMIGWLAMERSSRYGHWVPLSGR